MSSFSIGQMNQLSGALERAHFTPEDVRRLGQNQELLVQINMVVHGLGRVEIEPHIIQLYDARPYWPGDVREHISFSGRPFFHYTPSSLVAERLPEQKGGREVDDDKVWSAWGYSCANAHVMNFLIRARPNVPYPPAWEEAPVGFRVFFRGTIFDDLESGKFIPGMEKTEAEWERIRKPLLDPWRPNDWIAVMTG